MAHLLRRLKGLAAPKPLAPALIVCAGQNLPVIFRRNPGARRLVLRLNPEGTAALVTVPKGVSRAQALDFAERSTDWLAERLEKRGDNIPLRAGARIPLRGEDHEIRHLAVARGTVTVDPAQRAILVPGGEAHLPRRVVDGLKRAARAELTAASRRYAEAMGTRYRRIAIRDQKSRWGSCTAAGDLSYSWRLILTPPYVLDYVAAHEVAHLVHLNHSRRFWRLVLTHCPEAQKAKRWLKAHGHGVHRVVL
jgi:predicted metal-dependent hydrolase